MTNSKHSEHDTEPVCFVILQHLNFKTSQAQLYSREYLNTQRTRNVGLTLTVGIHWRISGHCGHQTAFQSPSDVRDLVI
jgi:hypothetical protein